MHVPCAQGAGRRKKKSPMQETKLETAAVMFVQRTQDSSLVNMVRKEEETISKQAGYSVKVVERAGNKLSDLLVKSAPFGGTDCGRKVLSMPYKTHLSEVEALLEAKFELQNVLSKVQGQRPDCRILW